MISVIIPTLNRSRCLARALRSLAAQDFPAHGFEVLVVDNGSTDPTRVVAERFISRQPGLRVRYIHEPEPGQLSARHRGAFEAAGDILSFIDDDIEADRRWLRAIRRSFSDPAVQIVGGRSLPRYEAKPPAWLDWFWTEHPAGRFCLHLSLIDCGGRQKEIDPNLVWGLNFSIRKSAFLELGGFHPDYIPVGLQHFQGDGETGLTMKAKRAGCRAMYQHGALVFHSIPKERMTPEYFEKRFFYAGVCDSFADLRRSGGRFEKGGWRKRAAAKLRERFARMTEFSPSDRIPEKQALVGRFNRAYDEGYGFHQSAVRASPGLRGWVLRKDYFDYRLPRLRARIPGMIT